MGSLGSECACRISQLLLRIYVFSSQPHPLFFLSISLINHPSHKLQHGDAYNYDTVIIALMIVINSMLGLPWLVAATVRSLNHIHAMATKLPNGKFVKVCETRLTGLGIHVLCLITIFALGLLQLIPMPVLYGVFLFMGIVSLGTNQFFGRILLFFKQPSRYGETGEAFAIHMTPKRIHIFTAIQLCLFVGLYVVKAVKLIAIAFPIIIALCIPIRLYCLPLLFTADELTLLDGDDDDIKKVLQRSDETGFDFNNAVSSDPSPKDLNTEDKHDGGPKKATRQTTAATTTSVVTDNNIEDGEGFDCAQHHFFSPPTIEEERGIATSIRSRRSWDAEEEPSAK